MTYYLTEKALRTCLVSGDCKIQSFDTRIAMEINIECAIFLHEIRSHDYQKNFDKKTHLLEKEDIESIINFLTYFFYPFYWPTNFPSRIFKLTVACLKKLI